MYPVCYCPRDYLISQRPTSVHLPLYDTEARLDFNPQVPFSVSVYNLGEHEILFHLRVWLTVVQHSDLEYVRIPPGGRYDTPRYDPGSYTLILHCESAWGTNCTASADIHYTEPKAYIVDPKNRPMLGMGSRDPSVGLVQWILNVKQDNIFGRQTRKAVKDFQRRVGLVPDGIVGPKTWMALARELGEEV